MDRNMLLIQKIHEAAGEKSQIAITKEWDTSFQNLFEDSCFKDKMFDYESFIKTAKELSDDEAEDTGPYQFLLSKEEANVQSMAFECICAGF